MPTEYLSTENENSGDPAAVGPERACGGATLTARQEAFAHHYVVCRNGAEAARRAGYKDSNARYAARDNLRNDAIRRRVRGLAAAQAEQRRDETVYLLMMLNAAMESALRQDMPNPMIRALALMARMTGLDKPAPALPAGDEENDGDAALVFADIARGTGLIQEAINIATDTGPHTTPTEHHKTPHPEKESGEAFDHPNEAVPAQNRAQYGDATGGERAGHAWAPAQVRGDAGDFGVAAPPDPSDSPVTPALRRAPHDAADGPYGADDAWATDRPDAVWGDNEGWAAFADRAGQSNSVTPDLSRRPCIVADSADPAGGRSGGDQAPADTDIMAESAWPAAPAAGRKGSTREKQAA